MWETTEVGGSKKSKEAVKNSNKWKFKNENDTKSKYVFNSLVINNLWLNSETNLLNQNPFGDI